MDSDSDFYGDDKTASDLEAQIDDPNDGWAATYEALDITLPKRNHEPSSIPPPMRGRLRNPYKGATACAWQLDETVDSFLARLPPESTDQTPTLPWIRIANPFAPFPEMPSGAEARFGERGMAKLHELSDVIDTVQGRSAAFAAVAVVIPPAAPRRGRPPKKNPNPSSGDADQAIAQKRQETVASLHAIAAECGVLTGKWMLFPGPEDVNDVWEVVARATARNELGCAAKVAPRDPEQPWRQRLVCVYTADCRDKRDVARVLERMRTLRLVRPSGPRIYYKSDSWTELGLGRDNKWGIKASMYDSSEIFNFLKRHGTS